MVTKKLAAALALLAFATPSVAVDVRDAGASTIFYISIPLEHRLSRKAEQWSAGLQLQGKREYQAITIDSRMLNFLATGGVEPKWIIAGLVTVGAAAAISRDKGSPSAQQQEQQVAGQSCPKPVADPCRK